MPASPSTTSPAGPWASRPRNSSTARVSATLDTCACGMVESSQRRAILDRDRTNLACRGVLPPLNQQGLRRRADEAVAIEDLRGGHADPVRTDRTPCP